MLVEYGATALLSWGCAGALSKKTRPGDLLLPHAIFTEDGQTIDTHQEWHQRWVEHLAGKTDWHEDMLLESSKVIGEAREKNRLTHRSGAIAVDMESAAIGRVAMQAGIPFMVIRAIADSADEGLPPYIAKMMSDKKQFQTGRLLPALLARPWRWPAMIRLGLHFRAATHTLKMVSEQSDPLFHLPVS